MKRTLLFALAMLLLVACGCSDSPTGLSTGTIVFVLDGDTCGTANRGSMTLYIDGSSVGTFEAAGNRELGRITVSAGQQHRVIVELASPRLNNYGSYDLVYSRWDPTPVTLKAGETSTIRLNCS